MIVDINKEQEARKRAMAKRKFYMQETDLTSAYLKQLYKKTEFCIYCGVLLDNRDMYTSKSLDHIIPLSKGGEHMKSNVRIICWLCNNTKRALFETDFLQKRFYPYEGVKVLDLKNNILLLEITEK